MHSRENMLKLILASFDYAKDGIARVILAKALTASPLVCILLLLEINYLKQHVDAVATVDLPDVVRVSRMEAV